MSFQPNMGVQFLSVLTESEKCKGTVTFLHYRFRFFQSSAGFFFRLDTSFYLEFSKAKGGGGTNPQPSLSTTHSTVIQSNIKNVQLDLSL